MLELKKNLELINENSDDYSEKETDEVENDSEVEDEEELGEVEEEEL